MRKKLVFHKTADQIGRSLVELLGVLAVIGVLALTGIYGFQYAMEKWRENETFDRYSKVVAGARTSQILKNEGWATKWYLNEADEEKQREVYEPQGVDMRQVISNIGDDLQTGFIYAPLKGPYNMFNKPANGGDWTEDQEKEVEIWVNVQTPEAFTVHAINLTQNACMRIVQANLGHSWGYEAAWNAKRWSTVSALRNNNVAMVLCQEILNTNKELVLWFGPWDCMGDECTPPPLDNCPSGNARPECKGDDECAGDYVCNDIGCCEDPNGPQPDVCPLTGAAYPECDDESDCAGDWICSQGCCADPNGITCPLSGNPRPECSADSNCAEGHFCNDGCCFPLIVPDHCPSGQPLPECDENSDCGEGRVCNLMGCCVAPDTPEVCPSGNRLPECDEDSDCGEDKVCNAMGCCDAINVPQCEEDKSLYCKKDRKKEEACNSGYCIYSTACVEWGCTEAPLMQDPTLAREIVGDEYPGWRERLGQGESLARDREIPMIGALNGKYPYCSLVLTIPATSETRCAVVSYCDEEPISVDGDLLQSCPSCPSHDTLTQVCVGNMVKTIKEARDGVEILKHFYPVSGPFDPLCPESDVCTQDSDCSDAWVCKGGCCSPDTCESGVMCETDTDCQVTEEEADKKGWDTEGKCVNNCCKMTKDCDSPCKDDEDVLIDGSCCPKGQAWFNCGSCVENPTYVDECGITRVMAKVCCSARSNAPAGCTGVGVFDGTKKQNSLIGDKAPTCFENYPTKDGQCCALACAREDGDYGGVCCDYTHARDGVCCETVSTAHCCAGHGGVWAATADDEKGRTGLCCGASITIGASQKIAYIPYPQEDLSATTCLAQGYYLTNSLKTPVTTKVEVPVSSAKEWKYQIAIACKLKGDSGNPENAYLEEGTLAPACCDGQVIPNGMTQDGYDVGICCPNGSTVYETYPGVKACCPNGQSVALAENKSGDKCCPVGQAGYSDENGDSQCCAKGSAVVKTSDDVSVCCPMGQSAYKDAGGSAQCCSGTIYKEGNYEECCPSGSTIYNLNSGAQICCPSGQQGYEDSYGSFCCPPSAWDGKQCNAPTGACMEGYAEETTEIEGGDCYQLSNADTSPESTNAALWCCRNMATFTSSVTEVTGTEVTGMEVTISPEGSYSDDLMWSDVITTSGAGEGDDMFSTTPTATQTPTFTPTVTELTATTTATEWGSVTEPMDSATDMLSMPTTTVTATQTPTFTPTVTEPTATTTVTEWGSVTEPMDSATDMLSMPTTTVTATQTPTPTVTEPTTTTTVTWPTQTMIEVTDVSDVSEMSDEDEMTTNGSWWPF